MSVMRRFIGIALALFALQSHAALSPIVLEAGSFNTATSAAAVTSNSVSPSAGELLIAVVWGGNGSAFTVSSLSEGGTLAITGSWEIVQTSVPSSAYATNAIAVARYASGSGGVTANFSASISFGAISVFTLPSGFDTADIVGTSQTGTGTTCTACSITLPATPASGSRLISSIIKYTAAPLDDVTEGTGWNPLEEQNSSNADLFVQETAGSNGTTVDFTLNDAAGSPSNVVMVGIEINEASAGGAVIPVLHHQLRNQ